VDSARSLIPFQSCAIIGTASGLNNNKDFVSIDVRSLNLTTCSANLFMNSGILLGNGVHACYMNCFRGVIAPRGNNGNGGRVFVGTLTPNTDRGGVTGCIVGRLTNDFERAPGEATAMLTSDTNERGAVILAVGSGTAFTVGGSQGAGSVDADGKFYLGVYGAQFIPQNAYRGEVTRPMLMRTGAFAAENNYPARGTSVMSLIVNTSGDKFAVNGGDIQLGLRPSSLDPENIFDWGDLPASDFSRGDDSEGTFWR